jgi:sugar diacid utilization regulator
MRQGAPVAVAVAHPIRPSGEDDLEPALRSVMRMIQQALPSAVFGKLVDVRDSEVRVIVCTDRNPGRRFLQALRRSGIGPRSQSVRIGVSSETTDIASIPALLHDAHVAVEFTTSAQPLIHFTDIELTEFLIRRADKDAFRLIPEWARTLNGEIAQTVHAFADCSLNVKQTARQLGVHPNTVYFRLNQISKLTGVNPRTFRGTALLVSALRLIKS